MKADVTEEETKLTEEQGKYCEDQRPKADRLNGWKSWGENKRTV